MIVRILGDRQYELPGSELGSLETLDNDLNAAIDAGDEPTYERALAALVKKVRELGTALDPAVLVPSDLTVPQEHSTLSDLKELLASEPDPANTAGPATAGTAAEGAPS